MTVALGLPESVAVEWSWKHGTVEAMAWWILTYSHGQGSLLRRELRYIRARADAPNSVQVKGGAVELGL